MLSGVLAHGAVGAADEVVALAAVPVVLLVLFVGWLRRRSQAQPPTTDDPR